MTDTFSVPPDPMLAIAAVAGEIERGALHEAELEWWADIDGQPTLTETGERRCTITLRSLDAARARWGFVSKSATDAAEAAALRGERIVHNPPPAGFDPDAVDWAAGADTPPED